MSAFLPILAATASLGGLFSGGTNALSKAKEIEVRSVRMDMDHKDGVLFFDGDVRVDYRPGYTLCADKLFIFFVGSNALDRIEAVGHVSITNETRVGACDHAIFLRDRNEIEMQAGAGRRALLTDGSPNVIEGWRIKFWLDAEQVEIVDADITVKKGGKDIKDLKP